jgi:hypothetical protein
MTRLNAIRQLPTEQKLTLSKVLNQWILDYETGTGDNDPAQWFKNRKREIEFSAEKAEIAFNRADFDMAETASNYYMAI